MGLGSSPGNSAITPVLTVIIHFALSVEARQRHS